MKKKTFSYYVRKKLEHEFVLNTFLNPEKFVEFLKKHEVMINKGMLERFEREGWLRPCFRIVIPNELQKFMLDLSNIDYFHRRELVEFPEKGDYKPWSDFKKGEYYDRKSMYYHPFQIMQVLQIMQCKQVSGMCYDSDTIKGLKKAISNKKKEIEQQKNSFKNAIDDIEDLVGFLMVLEEPYRLYAFGDMPNKWEGDNVYSWDKWKDETFSPKEMINELDLSADELVKRYEEITREGLNMDPLRSLYDLARIMRPGTLKQLTGKPLTAQLYYGMTRMIRCLYYDLTKKHLDEPDILDPRNLDKEKKIYSKPFDYGLRRTKREIIRFFIGDPTTRVYLLVEGDTEVEVIREIFNKLQVSMIDDNINVINRRGIKNFNKNKLAEIIQNAKQDHISVFIIADNEGDMKKAITEIGKELETDFEYHIWNKNFEEDNFEKRKIIDLINSWLKKKGECLTYEMIAEIKGKTPLIKAIEGAYYIEYHERYEKHEKKNETNNKLIYNTTGKRKQDIALELIKPRLKQILPRKRAGKPLPIEKVLYEVLEMTTYWRF